VEVPREAASFGASGIGGWRTKSLVSRVARSRVAKSLRGKVSELTDHRVSGIREPSVQHLNSRSHEFRFPDKSRKGIARENCGSRFPDREIEEP
jgi:hypothetical protein